MRAAAVVPAAGKGVRFGRRGRRKQFRELAGTPVVLRACRTLGRDPAVDWLVLVLPPDVAEDPPPWCDGVADRVVAGGESRRASVWAGLEAAPGEADVILVHDGVRPLVTPRLVRAVREAAEEGPVVPVVRIRDTVKEVDAEGRVVATLDRDRLRRVQTPQGFPAGTLRKVHRRAREEGWEGTDDASLCERAGEAVATVPGDPRNLKVTTPSDLARAEWLLGRSDATAGDGAAPAAG